jgi:hypothetical protein
LRLSSNGMVYISLDFGLLLLWCYSLNSLLQLSSYSGHETHSTAVLKQWQWIFLKTSIP